MFAITFLIGMMGFIAMPALHKMQVIDLIDTQWTPVWLMCWVLAAVSVVAGIMTV